MVREDPGQAPILLCVAGDWMGMGQGSDWEGYRVGCLLFKHMDCYVEEVARSGLTTAIFWPERA